METVVNSFIQVLGRQIYDFNASLLYRVSSRTNRGNSEILFWDGGWESSIFKIKILDFKI